MCMCMYMYAHLSSKATDKIHVRYSDKDKASADEQDKSSVVPRLGMGECRMREGDSVTGILKHLPYYKNGDHYTYPMHVHVQCIQNIFVHMLMHISSLESHRYNSHMYIHTV